MGLNSMKLKAHKKKARTTPALGYLAGVDNRETRRAGCRYPPTCVAISTPLLERCSDAVAECLKEW